MKEQNDFYAFEKRKDSFVLSYQFSEQQCALLDEQNPQAVLIEVEMSNDFLSTETTLNELTLRLPTKKKGSLCIKTQGHLYELMMYSEQNEAVQKIFVESKILVLLLCAYECCFGQAKECKACKFLSEPSEYAKVRKCQKLILEHLSDAPTIQELSRMVGMNECYLKKGFKEVYGQTIFTYLQEQRMQKARLLLGKFGYTVKETADELGYTSPSNFSTAFKKYVGQTPSELVKQ